MNTRKQLAILAIFVLVYAFLAFLTVVFFQAAQQAGMQSQVPAMTSDLPVWLLGLANAGIILVVYGPHALEPAKWRQSSDCAVGSRAARR